MTATRRLYILLAALGALGLIAALLPAAMPLWLASSLGLTIAACVDALAALRARPPELERDVPRSVALGVWTDIGLTLRRRERGRLRFELFDRPPTSCEFEGMPLTATIASGQRLSITYRVRATERGEQRFEPAHLRLWGPLGLWRRQVEAGDEQVVRVLPNFRAVSRYAMLSVADRVGQLGIRQIRRRGTGMEFDHLREYRDGDLTRQIDWKATARRRKLISREYQDERNQQVVLMLDCGRRMRAHDGDLTHFDHVLNASLLLSHVALRQGDSVAVTTFGGQDLWIPRQRGPRAIGAIVDRLYDLQTTTAPSDFADAARKLAARQRRRSLVILLTNLYDSPGEDLQNAIHLLRSRHLVLVASLREAASDALADVPLLDFEDALRVSAAHEYLQQRARAHATLKQQGVLVLDVPPADLSVALVNRYLEIKRAGAL